MSSSEHVILGVLLHNLEMVVVDNLEKLCEENGLNCVSDGVNLDYRVVGKSLQGVHDLKALALYACEIEKHLNKIGIFSISPIKLHVLTDSAVLNETHT